MRFSKIEVEFQSRYGEPSVEYISRFKIFPSGIDYIYKPHLSTERNCGYSWSYNTDHSHTYDINFSDLCELMPALMDPSNPTLPFEGTIMHVLCEYNLGRNKISRTFGPQESIMPLIEILKKMIPDNCKAVFFNILKSR